jgi:hypothetical protein
VNPSRKFARETVLEIVRPLRAVKTTSRSRRKVGFGAECGPSRGDPCRPAIRPSETFPVSIASDCCRPCADLQLQLANEREAQESGHRLHPQTQAAKSQNVRGYKLAMARGPRDALEQSELNQYCYTRGCISNVAITSRRVAAAI